MKKEFKGAGALKFLEILDGTPLGGHFLTYAGKRAINPSAVEGLMASESFRNEFIAKCEWIQHVLRQKLQTNDVSMESAAMLVNADTSINSASAFESDVFDGFIHFIMANEKKYDVLDSLMKTWVSQQGRTLVELDFNGLTPIEVAVYTNNVRSFAALASHGVDVTVIGKDGLSPLHIIVSKIKEGSADKSLLDLWMKYKLPIDMISGEKAGVNANKTAIELAQSLGLNEAVEILRGNGASVAADSIETPVESALLKAVKCGDIIEVTKLAVSGVGTTELDAYKGDTYHVLNYVVSFGGAKSVKMIEVLSAVKIDISHEKAEQALVHSLYPVIKGELAVALIKAGVATKGALNLFAENGFLPQIQYLLMKGAQATAEFDEIIAEKGLTETVAKYKLAENIIAEIQTDKEIMQFLLMQIIEGGSLDRLTYKGEELAQKYIDHFEIFEGLYKAEPLNFAKICKTYELEFSPRCEEYEYKEELVENAPNLSVIPVVRNDEEIGGLPIVRAVEEKKEVDVVGSVSEAPE